MTVEIKGTQALIKNLNQFQGWCRDKANYDATKAAAQFMARRVRANAPDQPWNVKGTDLKSSIKVVEMSKPGDPQIKFAVTNDKKKGFYAHIVELGSTKQHHWPVPKRTMVDVALTKGKTRKEKMLKRVQSYGKAMYGYSKKHGKWVFFGRRVLGGPIPPHPFMRPAFDESWQASVQHAGKRVGFWLQKYKAVVHLFPGQPLPD